MSTRSAIARHVGGDAWSGVYHHWDGYPTALGKTLWDLYHGFFGGDLSTMLTELIDAHPAGWSSINGADFRVAPGYIDNNELKASEAWYMHEILHPPECFCHGDRNEEPMPIDQNDDAGMEWAYVFDEEHNMMAVLERVRDNGSHATGMFGTLGIDPETKEREDRWALRWVVNLERDEPPWTAVECGSNLERCHHLRWYHDDTICRRCDGIGFAASGGHRGDGSYPYPCSSNCVPETEAPEPLRSENPDPTWHLTPTTNGFVCGECNSTGKRRPE